QNLVPAFPQRSPPWLLTTAACGGLRSTPDCRPRRALLHLSYSCIPPCGPAIFVTQDPQRTLLIWPAIFVPSLSTKGGAPESVYVADPQEWRQFLEPGVSCPQVAHRILI